MRLSKKELNAITQSFEEYLSQIPFKLYLFGSRSDDNKRGGDIDLLVVVPQDSKDLVVGLKSKIRSKIFSFIDEQKIDITVATETELHTEPFIESVMDGSILLLSLEGK